MKFKESKMKFKENKMLIYSPTNSESKGINIIVVLRFFENIVKTFFLKLSKKKNQVFSRNSHLTPVSFPYVEN